MSNYKEAEAEAHWYGVYGCTQSGNFFGFIPPGVEWEMRIFLTREVNFARERDLKFLMFFSSVLVFLCFFGGVFVLFGVFVCFSRVSAEQKNVFFGSGMSLTGSSRSGCTPLYTGYKVGVTNSH